MANPFTTTQDLRNADLCVDYSKPTEAEPDTDVGAAIGSLLPMISMLYRSKIVSWAAITLSGLSLMVEASVGKPGKAGISFILAFMSLATYYAWLFVPTTI